jgi:imidazolonepropionase-like amidohydrolase
MPRGASQVKLMAGGGVASNYDPLDVAQYTEREIRAAVDAAENWGTYVTVHAYTPRAVRTAIAAGVRCIEHGQLLDEETVALMAENGIWWCLQPFLDDEDAPPDLILVDGDPVADISLITRPRESFLAIIKGGQLVKGTDRLSRLR